MAATVAQVLRRFGAQYLATHALNTPQAKAWRGIVACRTAALGGQQLACDACEHRHWQYHSCRNRHCPQCGARAKDAWLQGRLAELLPVPYAHLVFTLPHSLNGLYTAHPRWVIDTLFACTAQTLAEFAGNARWMGTRDGTPALSLVLHTWTQDLRLHIHVHAVMACGVLAKDEGNGCQWRTPTRKPDFLFPVQALSKVFRGKFLAALTHAHDRGDLPHDPQGQAQAWRDRQRQLYRHDWVVYAKTPMGGPAQVLEYLSRYTHRTAISNERIRAISAEEVAFTVRSNDQGGKRLERLRGVEFVRRFLLHVLPSGIKRIRHYGVLAPGCKAVKLSAARLALHMPTQSPQAMESAQGFMARVAQMDVGLCPCCKLGRLQVIAVLVGQASLPVPADAVAQHSRGPP
ncbi:IS91 family transposase [Rhodoferax sp.]|uniref:IS91 family transposase n=1 Tax=Rhodoferax sp. TaxID=50421 RepID=UPI002ACE9B06|nr:IS91 family transposase [Rhodoferax sp.]MDZ7919591.1 IS91 family transposase [Rhodoferax sp.]